MEFSNPLKSDSDIPESWLDPTEKSIQQIEVQFAVEKKATGKYSILAVLLGCAA